jgi:lysophospholipase L1-like esterase
VGAQLQLIMGTAGTQARLSGIAVDASGNPLGGTNFGTTPASVTGQADYDRGFIGVGWATGVGGTPANIDIGVSMLLLRPREVAGFRPFDLGAPTSAPATYSKILQITHSMGNGTVTDPTWSNVAPPAGWTFYEDSTPTTPFPAGTTPAVGPTAYLMLEADAFARPATGTKWLIRCSTNGRAMGATGFDLDVGDAITAVAARGEDPDLIVLWMGANDAQSADEYALYSGVHGLIRIVRMLRYEYPSAVIVLMGERTSDAGTYPYIADGSIEAHKQAVAAQFPYVYYVSAAAVSLTDAIHPSAVGYADMAARAFDVLP